MAVFLSLGACVSSDFILIYMLMGDIQSICVHPELLVTGAAYTGGRHAVSIAHWKLELP